MAGRPKAIIDWKRVDQMLMAGCNGQEVSSSIGIHYNTLVIACRREHKCEFSEYSQQKREHGNQLLRMAQYKKAMDGDTTMQIWLGKNRLGQSDKKDIRHSGEMGPQLVMYLPDNGKAAQDASGK